MGFSFSSKKAQEAVPSSKELQLNRPEVEALLVMIKESTFKGDQVEHVYNLVFKLQEYYKSLTN
jgi:hypothetical protein